MSKLYQDIWERNVRDVLSWEHYGINTSSLQNINIDYQYVIKMI